MPDPMIFDCWAAYGPQPGLDPDERWTLDHLREDLDFYGLAAALVRHRQGYWYEPMHVNRRLCDELADYRDRLVPCWTVAPHQCGDFPPPHELARAMDGEGVRAVCLYPQQQGIPVHADVLAPLAELLNARHALILVPFAELGGRYEPAVAFCRMFSGCPVILTEASWSEWRMITAVLDACPNAAMEFHRFQGNRAVEWMAERYGIGRMFFGSGLLACSAGAARGFIDFPLLDDQALARFAGGNLRAALGAGPTAPPPVPEDADPLIRAARSAKPLGVSILDAHCHVLDDGLNGAGCRYVMPQGDLPHMLELARRMGVSLTAMMSWAAPIGNDIPAGNALIARCVAAAPEEVIGLSSCDPVTQSPDAIRAMCQELHVGRGFRGLKPYYRNGLSYADPRYAPWWEFAEAHRLYGLLHPHPDSGGIAAVCALAERYPEVTFLIAHACGHWKSAREAAEVISRFANVMAEVTLTPVPNGIIEWMCRTVGADRVLFGTDAPMRDPRPQLGWCVYTRLGLEDKKRILGVNFARILARARLPGHDLPAAAAEALND